MSEATTTRVLEPEVMPFEAVVAEETALSARIEQSFIRRMEAMENAAVMLERRVALLDSLHTLAIRQTRPEDWVLHKAGELITGMLTASGADLVANVYGIEITNIRPLSPQTIFQPHREDVKGQPGVFLLRAWCDCKSHMTGRAIEGLEFTRRSDEKFVGRTVDADNKMDFQGGRASESDLRAAVQTGLRTKAVRVLCAMTRVPVSDLERAWNGTSKKVSQCREGSGYGTSGQRKATASAEPGAANAAEEFWKEILRRTAGDETAAHEVLRDITKYPEYKKKDGTMGKAWPGAKTFADLNTAERIEKAKAKLLKHEVFGDDALARKDAED